MVFEKNHIFLKRTCQDMVLFKNHLLLDLGYYNDVFLMLFLALMDCLSSNLGQSKTRNAFREAIDVHHLDA